MHHGDQSDVGSLNRIINKINPDEIYNLAAQSHVKISFQIPEYTSDVNALGPLRLLLANPRLLTLFSWALITEALFVIPQIFKLILLILLIKLNNINLNKSKYSLWYLKILIISV